MIKIDDKSKCVGCFACSDTCPQNCISMHADEEGFFYPDVNTASCVSCGLCEKVCPVISPIPNHNIASGIHAYAAYSRDEKVRRISSSGGVFTEIATYIIRCGGVVFGAAFDESWRVKHICVDSEENIGLLRGSKYTQSYMGDTYEKVKNYLDCDKLVLFTGTPCQIGGLQSFLGKQYDNLFTQDIICHGVPSPLVWRKYLTYKVSKNKSIDSISFRDKPNGWTGFHMTIVLTNGKILSKRFQDDEMMRAFLRDLCLRPSCYNCAFKTNVRPSDITLADFWGVQEALPEMHDNKGTSLVFVNSKKGAELFSSLQPSLIVKETEKDQAAALNPAMEHSAKMPDIRTAFMRDVVTNDFRYVAKKYLNDRWYIIVKRYIRQLRAVVKRILK